MSPDKSKALSGPESAVIFIISLNEELAAQVMKKLDPKDIKRIANFAFHLHDISEDDIIKVKKNFLERAGNSSLLQLSQSAEIMRKLICKVLPEEKASEITEYIETGLEQSEGLDILKWMDAETLASFIRNEHPQTISLILAHLEPIQAAKVLTRLDEKSRTDVIVRIAALEKISPHIVQEINDVLRSELLQSGLAKSSVVGGINNAADILNFVEKKIESQILTQIQEVNPALAEHIEELMFVFDDLINLDDRSMQTIMKEISNDQLILALKTARDEMKEKIFKNISERASAMIKEELELMGPVRLADVESAQNAIVKVARKLEEEGKLVLSKKGSEETLV